MKLSKILKYSLSNVKLNTHNNINGLDLLQAINDNIIKVVFFDPQYRGVMDKLSYGNEGSRQKKRALLQQMSDDDIVAFIQNISRILTPSGHLFLWLDKFHLCEGIHHWLENTNLKVVDLLTWDKTKMGMGYRTRRQSEYLLILQKKPIKAKGYWKNHGIRDVWSEYIGKKSHPHQKPLNLQIELIKCVSEEKDTIVDPCAGSYSVLQACGITNRNFLGTDILKQANIK